MLERLITIAAVPLGILNAFGGLVAVIWLAILGEWGTLGYGLVGIFLGAFALGFAMMPGLLFAIPAAMLIDKGYERSGTVIGFLSAIYTALILTTWCMGVLYLFVMRADSQSLAPVLLLAYGVATGPISWMAQKESQHGGGEFAVISSLFAQIAFIAVVGVAFIVAWPFFDLALLFAAIMGVGLLFQFRLAFRMQHG